MKELPADPYGPAKLDSFEGKGYAYEERKLWYRTVTGVFLHAGSQDELTGLLHRGRKQYSGPVYRAGGHSEEILQVRVRSIRQGERFNRVYFHVDE